MPRKDHFEEFPDTKFADLTGRKNDVNCAVRPTLCELLPTRLCQILWHDLRPVLPDRIIHKRYQLKNRFCRKGRYDCLVDLVNVIEQLDYCPQVLLSRKESSLSYRLLVDTIGELGPLPDIGEGHCPRRHAIDACGAFARVLGPDCWTAYFRDRRLNRATFLDEKGLDFPEAMSGFVWKNDLPTRILFNDVPDKVRRTLNLLDDSPVQLYPPSILTELLNEGGHMTGTFRCRERMDSDRVIGVRLLWDNSTLVLFLGWRVTGASKLEEPENGVPEDPKQKRNAGDFWAEVTQLARAGAEQGKLLRSLELATRYFNVWLAAGSSGLAEEEEGLDERAMDRTSRLNHAEIIQRVAAAASLPDEESRANELRLAVHTAVSEAHHYHVHWVVKKEGARKKKGPRRVLRIRNARLKSCADGYVEDHDVGSANSSGSKSSGRPGPTTYELPIEPEDPNNQQRFAKRSVCVQSLLWRVGLLIDHSRDKVFWTRRRLSRVEFPNQVGELAVPILDETGEAEGVISVESHKPLKFDDLRRVEMISHLYRKLRRVFADEERDKQVDELAGLDERRPITSFQHVAKPFCAWVRDQLHADLAYLVIYDARFNEFRPMGISIGSALIQRFLRDPKECINLGMPDDQMKKVWSDELWDAYLTSGREKGGVHGLAEHAVISRMGLRTRLRRRLTWQLFNAKEPAYYPNTSSATDETGRYYLFPESTRHYAKAILGIPFRHDEHAHADGVLWVCWNRNRPESKETLGGPLSRLQPVLEAIAAVYSVHQYHDPDEALNPLPFRTATPTD